MGWVSGDYLIRCCHCQKRLYRSEGRRDRNKLLSCLECRDLPLSTDFPTRQLPKDPYPISKTSFEGPDTFTEPATWDTITDYWNLIEENWDEL